MNGASCRPADGKDPELTGRKARMVDLRFTAVALRAACRPAALHVVATGKWEVEAAGG
jgi:hypothetical protein